MKYPTEILQDVNTYVVDDLDITVAGVGHNSGDVPSDEDVRIATLAAEGWNVFDRSGMPEFTVEDSKALQNGKRLVQDRNTFYVEAVKYLHDNPRADATTLMVLFHAMMRSDGSSGVASDSATTVARIIGRSERSVRHARETWEKRGVFEVNDRIGRTPEILVKHDTRIGSLGSYALIAEIEKFVGIKRAAQLNERAGVQSVAGVGTKPRKLTAGVGDVTPEADCRGVPQFDGGPRKLSAGTPEADFRRYLPSEDSSLTKVENLTTVELGDRGVGKGDPAVAGRSLAKANDFDLFKDPCRQPLAPAVETVLPPCPQPTVEVIPLVAAVQLPAKVNKRSAVGRDQMKTPIDPSWELSEAGRQYARDLGLSDEQIDDAAFSFVGWHNENSHRSDGRFKDWGRRWMDWARKQAGYHRDRGTLGATGKRALPGRGAPNAVDEVIVTFGFGSKVYRKDINKWVAEARESHPNEDITDERVSKATDTLREQYEGKKDRQKADTVLREELTLGMVKWAFIDIVSNGPARREAARKAEWEAIQKSNEQYEARDRERRLRPRGR